MREQAVTVRELAAILGVHEQTVYTKAAAGDIPGFRVGRAWRFFPSQVQTALVNPDPWARRR